MHPRPFSSRIVRVATRRWNDARLYWDTADKEPWIFVLILGLIATVFAFALSGVFAYKDERLRAVIAYHKDRENLDCLARNVYFEARGEPLPGQYAVAEVTMNRTASGRFPDTVCGVVYQKSWDWIRKRYVGAFSWTEFSTLPAPAGQQWEQARKAAEAVYFGKEPPVVEGALFYHASYIKPDWAARKKPLVRIGQHIFYK